MADIMKELSSQDALTQAILAAQLQPGNCTLAEARFGQYTAETGRGSWYWKLDFVTSIGNDGFEGGDTFAARTRKIIDAWTAYAEKRAALAADAERGEEDGRP
ncbi:MAG: hypothetical protein JWM19_902 [Actinomycetia bacterium]|nr:hypothetical protein [Actinomycetes bacterium]